MSTEISKIVNSFIKFLKQDKIKVDKLNSIDDILKIPISSYNFLNKELASKLTELFEIVDIESAAKLKKDKIFKYYLNLDESKEKLKLNENEKEKLSKLEHLEKKYHDFKRILEKLIKISSIILSVKKKEAGFEIDAQKVVVAGLDNAGKTAILSKFGDKLGLKDLLSLKPTKGVERRHIKIKNSDVELFVLDLGGQVKYRSNYLKNPEKYFLNTTLLIYVIDIQDPNRFHESFNYFEEILNTLILLEENPYLMVYIHKYDPDLRHDPEILLNVEFVR
ncbi:MAG: ADP-ribosylation factor-like protein, partial [Promethearchaeota archaeon]